MIALFLNMVNYFPGQYSESFNMKSWYTSEMYHSSISDYLASIITYAVIEGLEKRYYFTNQNQNVIALYINMVNYFVNCILWYKCMFCVRQITIFVNDWYLYGSLMCVFPGTRVGLIFGFQRHLSSDSQWHRLPPPPGSGPLLCCLHIYS